MQSDHVLTKDLLLLVSYLSRKKFNKEIGFPKTHQIHPTRQQKAILLKIIYTPVGDPARMSFEDEQNHLHENRLGFAEMVIHYDASWTKTSVDYLIAEGKIVGRE